MKCILNFQPLDWHSPFDMLGKLLLSHINALLDDDIFLSYIEAPLILSAGYSSRL